MFYLKGRGGSDTKVNGGDFGWWLSPVANQTRDCRSSGSSSPILSCIDSDDECYTFAHHFKQEFNDACEKIELTSFMQPDLDLDLIEKDAIRNEMHEITPYANAERKRVFNKSERRSPTSQGICYTPERLVRSQEYRILTPSPRYLSQARITPENENPRKANRCRRRLNYLIDSEQVGACQLKALFNLDPVEGFAPPVVHVNTPEGDSRLENPVNITDQGQWDSLQASDSISKGSSYERLNIILENRKKATTRCSSPEDTSGIQWNDVTAETQNIIHNTPLCLCDELAAASENYKPEFPKGRGSAINEVVSILEVLETDPDKAAVLLEGDRFCDSTSSHDQLTRLALAIETDANVPGVLEDPENFIHHLQEKIENLQVASKDIYRDICNLRRNFQYDEEKMADISSGAMKLRQDVHDVRYLDDLLNLLEGELDGISSQKWPFIIGHVKHQTGEINLII